MKLAEVGYRGRPLRVHVYAHPRNWRLGRFAWPRDFPHPLVRSVQFGPVALLRIEEVTAESAEANRRAWMETR